MKKSTLFIVAMVILFSAGVQSQSPNKFGINTESSPTPEGLKIGSLAPNIVGSDQFGSAVDLYNLLEKGSVVVFFYRGNWCPYCNNYLANMKDSLLYILNEGAKVIAVSPESRENVISTSKETDSSLIVLPDPGNKIMDDYKVLFDVSKGYQIKIKAALFTDIAKHNNQESAQLPIPACYVIANKKILYKHFDLNYKERAPVSEIINALKMNNK